MNIFPLRSLMAAALLITSPPLHAEVQETVDIEYYDARIQRGQTLLAALNAASSIRQDDLIYHGYTRWDVHWHYWWDEIPGSCRITNVTATVKTKITLPRAHGGTDAQMREFERYSIALKEHEMGHARLGKDAAKAIHRGILALPAEPTCSAIERAAEAKAQAVLRDYESRDRDYDASTRHGRDQGAWVER